MSALDKRLDELNRLGGLLLTWGYQSLAFLFVCPAFAYFNGMHWVPEWHRGMIWWTWVMGILGVIGLLCALFEKPHLMEKQGFPPKTRAFWATLHIIIWSLEYSFFMFVNYPGE